MLVSPSERLPNIPGEPAWHRRRRRSRTAARTVLRNFTSGLDTPQRTIDTAIRVLEGHHSDSRLPALAREMLKQQSWWCYACRRNVKGNANFCPGCGQQWSAVAYSPDNRPQPRQQDWGHGRQQPASPRRRNPSPRQGGRGGQQGQQRPKGPQDKGRGKGKTKAPAPAEPSGAGSLLAALPRAPQEIAVSMPGTGSEVEKAPMLSELVAALSAVKEELPSSVQSVLQQHLEEDVRLTSKGLHRLVSQQTTAKKELQAVRHAREVFLTEWTSYLGSLSELLEKQTAAKAVQIQKLDEAEAKWTHQLASATQAITTQSAQVVDLEAEDAEDMEDIVNTDAAKEAAKTVAAQRSLQGEDQLVQALRSAKTAADQELNGLRERTPRRKNRTGADGDLGTSGGKDGTASSDSAGLGKDGQHGGKEAPQPPR